MCASVCVCVRGRVRVRGVCEWCGVSGVQRVSARARESRINQTSWGGEPQQAVGLSGLTSTNNAATKATVQHDATRCNNAPMAASEMRRCLVGWGRFASDDLQVACREYVVWKIGWVLFSIAIGAAQGEMLADKAGQAGRRQAWISFRSRMEVSKVGGRADLSLGARMGESARSRGEALVGSPAAIFADIAALHHHQRPAVLTWLMSRRRHGDGRRTANMCCSEGVLVRTWDVSSGIEGCLWYRVVSRVFVVSSGGIEWYW